LRSRRAKLRDGILLILLGLAAALWLVRGGDPASATLGWAVAAWGLALVGQVVWLRSRRRT
jgi:hypothetical protein